MKILFTGSGTGGHFYPNIAVAEALYDLSRERKLLEPQLYYAAPEPYDREALVANNITFIPIAAGKMRRYFSLLNTIDYFKIAWGALHALVRIFFLYPDVIFGTGGYASFPTFLAGKILGIPVVVFATDAEPSRVNAWAARFAVKIAVSFPEATKLFPPERVAYTGNPIRKTLLIPAREGAYEFLKLDPNIPVIYVTGGSQGAVALNDALLSALPSLLERYQVIHQCGAQNLAEVEGRAKVVLSGSAHSERYKPFGFLNELAIRMVAGVSSLAISRAGASSIFELATWGIPTILVPIPEPISHDQSKNAYSYARSGAAVVIEQNNLTAGLLVSEVDRILDNKDIAQKMSVAARGFARADAARGIAEALLAIGISHEE